MVASSRSGSVLHRRSRRGAGIYAFLARLDRLVDLVAQRRGIEALERPLRARVAAEMLTYARRGGVDQFRRPGGLVSLVEPQPRWEYFDQQAFAGWLIANGYDQLVRERVVIIDHASVIGLLRRPGPVQVSKLHACMAVMAEPLPDALDHLDVQMREDGMLLTRNGQVVPGVRRIAREPWVQVCAGAPIPGARG
jgi:hypothetical protein